MKSNQVKEAIRKMKNFDIDKLNAMANKAGLQLSIVVFWYNAIKN